MLCWHESSRLWIRGRKRRRSWVACISHGLNIPCHAFSPAPEITTRCMSYVSRHKLPEWIGHNSKVFGHAWCPSCSAMLSSVLWTPGQKKTDRRRVDVVGSGGGVAPHEIPQQAWYCWNAWSTSDLNVDPVYNEDAVLCSTRQAPSRTGEDFLLCFFFSFSQNPS